MAQTVAMKNASIFHANLHSAVTIGGTNSDEKVFISVNLLYNSNKAIPGIKNKYTHLFVDDVQVSVICFL